MTSRKLCSNTNGCKQPAATNCEGCSQALCTKHFIEHRQLLTEQLDIIIGERDQFQETLNQSTINSKIHPFIQQIDDWENKSIAKIREKAENLRSELFQHTTVHIDHLSKKLQDLSKKLREAKEHESFVETDLCNWNESVNVLRNELTLPSAFRISQCDTNPFIQNISIKTNAVQEIFERTFDNSVKTEENGRVAIHNSQRSYTEIRGKLEYTLNRHTIRLHIEYLSNNWAFFGVTSKSTPLQNHSYRAGSAYGWSSNNYLWLNGQGQSNKTGASIEMKTNDIICLILDCDQHKIFMINERTITRHELLVDIRRCPFPWQLHVVLYEPNYRLRILPSRQ